jgi:CheY-like chemotaxis protein
MLSFASIKRGDVATRGSTSAMLDRSLFRLQTLIDQSLADVRLDAGLLNLVRVPVWEIIEEAEIGAMLIAQAKGLHFEVSSVDRSVIVEADRPILAAALANLLQNAFKFTRPGCTVKLRATTSGARVLIEVEDQCGGLPAGATERLLKPFVQKGPDRTGLGLGLSICLKAVKMMAGELHIRDLPGHGCVFTIDLPKRPPPPLKVIDGGKNDVGSRGAAGALGPGSRVVAHLLLVDDDNDVVELFAEFLRGEGHQVRTASTGEEGLVALRSAPLPDLLVLDVDMPVLGGPGMAHKMLLHDAGEEDVPILLMSGREDLPQIAGQMGTRYFLKKPADIGQVLEMLGRALRERSAPSTA